jgi:hypothetical protein
MGQCGTTMLSRIGLDSGGSRCATLQVGAAAADLEDVSRVLALLLALTAWACSAWALLVGVVWGLGLKCDDSCSAREGWRGDPDAWQWNGLAALGLLAFAAGAAFFVFVWRRRPWSAAVAMIVGFGSVLVMVNPLTSEWIDHLDRRSPGELLLMTASVFAPVFAVLLTVPETVDRGRPSALEIHDGRPPSGL